VSTATRALCVLPVAMLAADPWGWSPFGPLKWLAVSTTVVGGGLLAVATNRSTPGHRQQFVWSRFLWPVLLTSLALATVVTDDWSTALLGTTTRRFGLLTWVGCWLMWTAGRRLGPSLLRPMSRACTIALTIAGGYALVELLHGPPIALDATTGRLMGPFGSAAYFGAALCLLVPMAVAVAADRTERHLWRATAVFAAVSGTVAVLGTGSRAALVGLVAGGVVAVGPSRRALIAAGTVGSLATALLIGPMSSVLDREHGTTSRLDEWQVAVRVIARHPLLGVAPEGYRIAVADGVDRDYERTYRRSEVLPDRAHSAPLDVAVAGGVPAALAWCGLVGGGVFLAVRRRRRSPVHAAAATAIAAYATQQLFLFPIAELDPLWWLLAGAVGSPLAEPVEVPSTGVRWLTAVAALPVLIVGVLAVAADRLADRAFEVAASDDVAYATQLIDAAADRGPPDVLMHAAAAGLHRQRSTLASVDAALEHCDAALGWAPSDPIALDCRGTTLLRRAEITGAAADVAAAVTQWRTMVDSDPNRARWRTQYGRALALGNDETGAIEQWRAALDLDPQDSLAAQLLERIER
jgi:O-antigen ligase